jgi:hypothetical protein
LDDAKELEILIALVLAKGFSTKPPFVAFTESIRDRLLAVTTKVLEIGQSSKVRQVEACQVTFFHCGFETKEGTLTFTCPEFKSHAETFAVMKLATKEVLRYLEKQAQDSSLIEDNDAIGRGGVPEVDKSDAYLSQALAAAAAKVPEGMLSAASLKAMFKEAFAEGHPHLANAKSGIFPSYPPVPVASGTMSDLPSVFHTNFGREITGLASSGLMEQRVLGLGPNGNLITSTVKKLNQSEFFTSLGYTIRSMKGTLDEEPLQEYMRTLRFILDLGFPFAKVLELDTTIREGWKQSGNHIVVDRAEIVQEFLLRFASDSLSSAGASTSGAKRQKIEYDPTCRGFNEGKCTYKPCNFRHECQKCGSKEHGAKACPRK